MIYTPTRVYKSWKFCAYCILKSKQGGWGLLCPLKETLGFLPNFIFSYVGGNCPPGNCPGANVQGAIDRGVIVGRAIIQGEYYLLLKYLPGIRANEPIYNPYMSLIEGI